MTTAFVNTREKEDVWTYPRPPALQKTGLKLSVIWTDASGAETVVAETRDAYRVLETSHPPTYYIPQKDVQMDMMSKTNKGSFCEWKGSATYYSFHPPGKAAEVQNRIWSYDIPTRGTKFAPIAGYVSFYASAGTRGNEGWKCYVGGEEGQRGEEVVPQDGDFYGGWKTAEHTGKMKGGPGTWGW